MQNDVTLILDAIERGDQRASEELLPLVYEELRSLAEQRLSQERSGQTLQATALVHEAYLKLLGPEGSGAAMWDGRGHFYAAAAEAMRRILIDRVRAKGALKRGGSGQRIKLTPDLLMLDEVPAEILDLDAALKKLAEEDAIKADLVKLRFFGGLTLKQAGTVLGLAPTTADRYWAYARAWLYHELSLAN